MMLRGFWLKLIIVGAIFSALIFIVFSLLDSSTLTITIQQETTPLSTSVEVDGKILTPSGQEGKFYTTKVGSGKHTIKITSDGYMDYMESVTIESRKDKTINANITKIQKKEVTAADYGDASIEIVKPVYFSNNTWVVYSVGSNQDNREGSLVVAKLDPVAGEWLTVDEGTEIHPSGPVYEDAPKDLIEYLEIR